MILVKYKADHTTSVLLKVLPTIAPLTLSKSQWPPRLQCSCPFLLWHSFLLLLPSCFRLLVSENTQVILPGLCRSDCSAGRTLLRVPHHSFNCSFLRCLPLMSSALITPIEVAAPAISTPCFWCTLFFHPALFFLGALFTGWYLCYLLFPFTRT